MFKATKLIAEELTKREIKFNTVDNENFSKIRVGFNNKTNSSEEYNFYSLDDDNDVELRSGVILSVPEEKTDAMLKLINEFNVRYRFFRWYLDEDNDLMMKAIFPSETKDADIGPVAFEFLIRASNLHDTIYSEAMKLIWG